MNEKFIKNATVKKLTKMFLSREEEKGLIVKDPFRIIGARINESSLYHFQGICNLVGIKIRKINN